MKRALIIIATLLGIAVGAFAAVMMSVPGAIAQNPPPDPFPKIFYVQWNTQTALCKSVLLPFGNNWEVQCKTLPIFRQVHTTAKVTPSNLATCRVFEQAERQNPFVSDPTFEAWITRTTGRCRTPVHFRIYAQCAARFIGSWYQFAPFRNGLGRDEHNSSKGSCIRNGHAGEPIHAWFEWLTFNGYKISQLW